MMRIPGIPTLPAGWRIRLDWGSTHARGRYAYASTTDKLIALCPKWWLYAPGLALLLAKACGLSGWWTVCGVALLLLQTAALYFALKHETGHAWGIPKSGCVGGNKRCVMAEETMLGYAEDSIIGKLRLLPGQIHNLGRFCDACKAKMAEAQTTEE
jgi:hypothetical protein